jgi:hypothetical protein
MPNEAQTTLGGLDYLLELGLSGQANLNELGIVVRWARSLISSKAAAGLCTHFVQFKGRRGCDTTIKIINSKIKD